MRRHYHVAENTPGYLCDDDVYVCSTKQEASDYAQSLADWYRDNNGVDGQAYIIHGNKREGYEVEDLNKTYDLGRVIWIAACQDDCEIDTEY